MLKTETLNRFLARQPILTREKAMFGYEILSRYGPENYFKSMKNNQVYVNAIDELFLMGIKTMTEGLPAFINCTREFLIKDYLTLMPRETVVGELLETIEADAEVIAACGRMKRQGYRLALDDYCDVPSARPLLEFADFVKIDVLMTSMEEQKMLVRKFRALGIPVLAEKVETDEQFQNCLGIGYDYFQGYFFCRPQILRRRSIPANKAIYVELLLAANDAQFDPQKIAAIFKRDVSLSYRLLKYLNSTIFAFRCKIHSIQHGLSLIGETSMRKWISLVSVAALGDEVENGLLKLPLLRAMFCELIGDKLKMSQEKNELFLLGLLSVMDALLNMPMSDVLKEISVDGEIKKALLGIPSRYRPIF